MTSIFGFNNLLGYFIEHTETFYLHLPVYYQTYHKGYRCQGWLWDSGHEASRPPLSRPLPPPRVQ